MSASDLVPQVVGFVTDLQHQYDEKESQLKEQEDERLLVQITGPNRTPIHYQGSMKNGYSYGDEWCLVLKDNSNGVISLHLPLSSSFTDLEIWLSGIFIDNFQNFDKFNQYFRPDDIRFGTGKGVGKILFSPGGETNRGRRPVVDIYALIGPMTSADYNKMMDEQLDLEEQLSVHDDLNLVISSIYFRKEKISGIMYLLQKLGIRTSDDDSDNDDDGDSDDDDDDHEDDDGDGDGDDDTAPAPAQNDLFSQPPPSSTTTVTAAAVPPPPPPANNAAVSTTTSTTIQRQLRAPPPINSSTSTLSLKIGTGTGASTSAGTNSQRVVVESNQNGSLSYHVMGISKDGDDDDNDDDDEAENLDGIPKDLPAVLVEEEDPSSIDKADENASADDDNNNDDDNVAGDVDNSIPNDQPGGWVEEEDPSSGKIYFCNSTTTGESSRERPMNTEEVEVINSLDRLNGTEPFNNEEEDNIETEGDARNASDNLPGGSIEQNDPSSGQIYFYNSTTGETSGDRPTKAEEEEHNASDNLPGGWVEQRGRLSGQIYVDNDWRQQLGSIYK